MRKIVAAVMRRTGRDNQRKEDVEFVALASDSVGAAWLKLPNTLDLRDPAGYFATEILARFEFKAERDRWKKALGDIGWPKRKHDSR